MRNGEATMDLELAEGSGAVDHLEPPVTGAVIKEVEGRPSNESGDAPERAASPEGFERIIGTSRSIDRAKQRARILTQVDAPVLLQGETGVGKDLFARAIHAAGRQRAAPFIVLNCAGLPRDLLAGELFGLVDGALAETRGSDGDVDAGSGAEAVSIGRIEEARGGTLFLDEIAELPLDLQPYLLRVLEGGEFYPVGGRRPRQVSFRLIASSSRDLRAEVTAGRFRVDLLYRISVTSLQIPPLRQRKDDLPALVDHFVDEVSKQHGIPKTQFAPEVIMAFARHSWPGNLRELRNAVEVMMLLADGAPVDVTMLPSDLGFTADSAEEPANGAAIPTKGLRAVERDVIGATLRLHHGNLSRTAKELRISRSTLYLKLKRHHLEPLLTELRLSPR